MASIDTGPEIDAIADTLRALQRLRGSRRVHAALSEAAETTLSQQAVQVLGALDDTLSVAELARSVRMDVGAVSRQLRDLEEKGYVRRAPSPHNASVVLVTATTRGRTVARRVAAVRNDHLARALADWSPTDRRFLALLLHRLADGLQTTPYAKRPKTPLRGRP